MAAGYCEFTPMTQTTNLQIDSELLLHDLEELATIGADPLGGITRIAYSPTDLLGRAWVAQQMHNLQLQVTSDAAGNTIGRYAGTQPLGAIVVGSHTDTVAQGGRFDGALGVLAGLACIRALRDAGVRLRHPIEVINFAAEEATVLGTLGSSALVGQLQASDLAKPAYDGRSIASHLVAAGFDPVQILDARRTEPVAAYLELHIEQGDVLEAENTPIGLVEGIVGIRRYRAIYTGQANHAGTTQMARRRDALVAAAQFILAVREVAIAHGIVGTIGTLNVQPNVPNVIPGRVELSCEIRGMDTHILERADVDLQQHARATGGVLEVIARGTPIASDPLILDILAACCEQRQIPYRRMPSGAGHDAMCMAALAPQAMLFVPSRAGISHAPDEYTAAQDCVQGAQLLLDAIIALDGIF
jgi:N-carbamoyl-L-amino-acid hydrolase